MSSQAWWQQPAKAIDQTARAQAQARQQVLTKPSGSLGQLEQLAIELAGMQGRELPQVDAVSICVFAGDHGIAAEGVSAYPQAVTGQMLANFVNGGAAISVLVRSLGAHMQVIDLGTATALPELAGVKHLALGKGTANFAHTRAMSTEQCSAALAAGRDAALQADVPKSQLFIGGEMGIANTTSATALACALLDCPVVDLTGPGTGLDHAGVLHKIAVIEAALVLHRPQLADPLAILQCLGGFEIAALVGAYLAAAQAGITVLVDGFICSVAALLAVRLNPSCRAWLLFAHQGAEPGHARVLQALEAAPLLQLGLRLGEGSGAALATPLLQMACKLHGEMATFDQAAVANRS